jgi:hypothetical protein
MSALAQAIRNKDVPREGLVVWWPGQEGFDQHPEKGFPYLNYSAELEGTP